jgi:hypothetical protein
MHRFSLEEECDDLAGAANGPEAFNVMESS